MNIKPDPTGTHQSRPPVFAGVDTHKDVHVAAVVDATGTMLGTGSFATVGEPTLVRDPVPPKTSHPRGRSTPRPPIP